MILLVYKLFMTHHSTELSVMDLHQGRPASIPEHSSLGKRKKVAGGILGVYIIYIPRRLILMTGD